MQSIFKRLFVFSTVLAIVAAVTYQVMAIGIVTEYPFLGSFNVSCGYHTICTNPGTAGYGLDFTHSTLPTSGKVTYASGRGTVITSQYATDWGETIVIDHTDVYNSRYAHLRYRFALVNQKMREGSPIGYMGNTGCGTCGAHLHFQVYNNTTTGQGVEPIPIDGKTTPFCGINQTCGPFNNSGFVTDMRLVDNLDAGFTYSGTATCWNNTTNGYHPNGLDQTTVVYYRYCNGTTGNPTHTGTWTPSLPATASYHIYAFIPNHAGITLSGSTEYKIYSGNVLVGTAIVNQSTPNNVWVSLGKFTLSTSGSYVKLSNTTLDGQKTAYDAMMFVRDF